ncbi:MAG TPA: SpoIIE family protein phosphatase [Acidimicrobiales bacterium]|nr:SpoIIE family protein phosphatase [Acidimicrobiales bacterium]
MRTRADRQRWRDISVAGYLLAVGGPAMVTAVVPHGERGTALVPALCYLLTVVAAVAVGRIGPGLLAAGLSTVGLLTFYMRPVGVVSADTPGEVFAVGVFALTALVASGVLDRLEAARDAAERAAERLTRLQAVTSALSQAVDIDHVTRVVVDQACKELGSERGSLSLVTEAGSEMRMVGAYNIDPDIAGKWSTYPVAGEHPAGDAVRNGRIVLITSLEERNQRYPAIADSPPLYDHALAVVPLLFEGRAMGAISLSFETPRAFPPEDVQFLEAMGAQCAQALERARLYEQERDSGRRQAFLADASRLLASSLEYEDTLARITRLSVPALADGAAVHLWDGDDLRLVALAHRDPEGEAVMRQLSARDGDVATDPTLRRVAITAEPVMSVEVPQELWADLAEDEEHRRLLEALGTRSALIVPLRARARPLGTLMLAMTTPGRQFGTADLVQVEDLAGRAAVAIENSLAHRARLEQARVLQQSLLPPRTPTVPGLDLATHYRAAGDGTIVGGDFFDVFPVAPSVLGAPRWGVVLGDVSGKGVEAASLTALTRYTVRAACMMDPDPCAVLRMCNQAVADAEEGEAFCTMVFAVIEPPVDMGVDGAHGAHGGGTAVRVASGGHPLPVLRTAAGEIRPVGQPGTAIGLFPTIEVHDTEITLYPGDTMVLFTDGLIEARTPAGDFAPHLLHRTMRASSGTSAQATLSAVTAAVGALEEGRARDDMAIVVLGVPHTAPDLRSVVLAGAPAILTLRSEEYIDELLREFELVRLGGRQGVLRSDYPQRLLAIMDEILARFASVRLSLRDQAEAALTRGHATFTLTVDLPVLAVPAMRQFLTLIDEVEAFAEAGHMLTLPPAEEVRQYQRWLVGTIATKLELGDDAEVAPFDPSVPTASDEGRTGAGAVPEERPRALVGPRVARTTLAADLAAASHARRFAHRTLEEWSCAEEVAERTELPLSELVTNAVMHTRSEVDVVLRLGAGALRVEVHDRSTVLPTRRSHDMDASTGRGLELVEALSDRWGVETHGSGKAVWFEVTARS